MIAAYKSELASYTVDDRLLTDRARRLPGLSRVPRSWSARTTCASTRPRAAGRYEQQLISQITRTKLQNCTYYMLMETRLTCRLPSRFTRKFDDTVSLTCAQKSLMFLFVVRHFNRVVVRPHSRARLVESSH